MARFTNIWCMSPSTEILTIGAFGFVHAATQCYWYFGEGRTDRILGSMDTKGHFTAWEDKIIRSALHGMEFMKNVLTPVHLFFYLLMFHALLFKKSPARMVPWLLLGALKDIGLGAVLTLSEAFICYVVNLPRPCAEVTIFLIAELAVQLYLWGSTLLLYQELANREIAAEGEAYWASSSSATPAVAEPSESASPSEWEAAPAGLRSTPKRRLDDSQPSLPDRQSATECPALEARPSKKRAVHGEAAAAAATAAAAGSRGTRARANKAVQANTLSRRWLLANANAPSPQLQADEDPRPGHDDSPPPFSRDLLPYFFFFFFFSQTMKILFEQDYQPSCSHPVARAAPKLKESASPRARRSGGRASAEASGAGVPQSRSQYAHRDVSPRAAAAWADEPEDAAASERNT